MIADNAICPHLQEMLDRTHSETCLTRPQAGFLDLLNSDLNTNGFTPVPSDTGNGQIRKVDLKYVPQLGAALTSNTPQDICGTSSTVNMTAITVDVNQYLTTLPIYLPESDLRLICNPNAEYVPRVIMNMINLFRKQLNEAVLALQDVMFGAYYNTAGLTVTKDFNVLTAAGDGGYTAASGVEDAIIEYNDIKGCDMTPMFIGDGKIRKATRLLNIGCCNSQGGVDMTKLRGEFAFFEDKTVSGIWGTDNFGMFMPGSTQLVTFNENRGDYMGAMGEFERDTLIDPIDGMVYDFTRSFNKCGVNKGWAMTISLYYALVNIPSDIFDPTDPMFGANGSLRGVAKQLT